MRVGTKLSVAVAVAVCEPVLLTLRESGDMEEVQVVVQEPVPLNGLKERVVRVWVKLLAEALVTVGLRPVRVAVVCVDVHVAVPVATRGYCARPMFEIPGLIPTPSARAASNAQEPRPRGIQQP